jgi:hypothetical protein
MTYGVKADPVARQYMETVLSDPDLNTWCQKAADESEVLEEEEVGK